MDCTQSDDNDIVELCKLSNYYEFINKLKLGLDTYIGDKSEQKQNNFSETVKTTNFNP